MMSRTCAALSDLNFSSDDSSNSEEDEKVKRKPDDFTSLCLMGMSLPEGLSLRVIELENTLCNQDKLLCKVFREKKS
jgi:hypothetical protein